MLNISLLTPTAKIPVRGSLEAAGLDLFADSDAKIEAGGRCLINTGIAVDVPSNAYGRIAPRSGLALKYGIDVGAGVVDSDYRGAIGVVLFNHGAEAFTVSRGDRIAQLIICLILRPEIKVGDLSQTKRDSAGFGSTGMK